MNLDELQAAACEIGQWLEWDSSVINDFHAYAQRFKGRPGSNVYGFVLRDALRYRGITMEDLRTSATPEKKDACGNQKDPLIKAVIALLRTSGSMISAGQLGGCRDLEKQIEDTYGIDVDRMMGGGK